MSDPAVVAKLLAELLSRDRVTTAIDSNNLVLSQNGQTINIPLVTTEVVRSSVSGFR